MTDAGGGQSEEGARSGGENQEAHRHGRARDSGTQKREGLEALLRKRLAEGGDEGGEGCEHGGPAAEDMVTETKMTKEAVVKTMVTTMATAGQRIDCSFAAQART